MQVELERQLYAAFPASEYQSRFARLRAELEKRELDAVLVTAKENVLYFSGLETVGWDSKHRPVGCILPRDRDQPILVIPESLAYVAEATSWIGDVHLWGGFKRQGIPPDPVHAIASAINGLGLDRSRIGLELGYGTRVGMSQADFALL